MLNKIWFALLFIGLLYGFAKGAWQSMHPQRQAVTVKDAAGPESEAAARASAESSSEENNHGLIAAGKRLNQAILDAADSGVQVCIFLIGIMAVWLGLLNVAKDAGLVDAFARLVRPLMRWLFPEVPDGHPAQGAILMNFAANILGLDNAATPMGLKAMRYLQELNPVKDTATNSMATFLAINASSITVVPFTIIGYRAMKHSLNPAEPVAGTVIATTISTVVAVIAVRWLSRLPKYRIAVEDFVREGSSPTAVDEAGVN